MTGRRYLSQSAVRTFQTCPLRWHFRYSLGLPEPSVPSSLVFGSAIHAAIEHHYFELSARNPAPDLDDLLAVYWAAWNGRRVPDIRFLKGESPDTLAELARRMLAAFLSAPIARLEGRVLAIEEKLTGPVVLKAPDPLARLDLVVATADALAILDFKTSHSRWSLEQLDEHAPQLLLYAGLAQNLAPDLPVRLRFAVLTKTKEPALELLEVPVSEAAVERTRQALRQVWLAMQAAHVHPVPSPMQCVGCPFRDPCGAWPS